jgi:hypothetical protein
MRNKNRSEALRKQARRKVNVRILRAMKQQLYYERTGVWEPDPTRLHWHHVDPSRKYMEVCRLSARSLDRILIEVEGCVVVDADEHSRLHREGQTACPSATGATAKAERDVE